jgi:dual specificity protein phosphatase-like protein
MRLPHLRKAGITHILNVGEAPSVIRPEDGPFVDVAWLPIEDLQRIPDVLALKGIGELHRMVCSENSNVYVHCIAGWNRSPTVVWLYLIACGMEPARASELITAGNMDAIPGHKLLIDDALVSMIQQYGQRFLPHPRPIALEPA